MNTEDYIKNHLRRYVIGQGLTVDDVYNSCADDIINKYRRHEYFDLTKMIDDAAESLSEVTMMITFLSRGGTIADFAAVKNISYGTARKLLNATPYASIDKSHRPYWYSIVD